MPARIESFTAALGAPGQLASLASPAAGLLAGVAVPVAFVEASSQGVELGREPAGQRLEVVARGFLPRDLRRERQLDPLSVGWDTRAKAMGLTDRRWHYRKASLSKEEMEEVAKAMEAQQQLQQGMELAQAGSAVASNMQNMPPALLAEMGMTGGVGAEPETQVAAV